MLKPVFLIAFSGHRPSDDPGRSTGQLEAMRPLIARALGELRSQAAKQDADIEFYASAAEGADIVACECAWEMGIPVHLILPMAEKHFEELFEHSPEALARLRTIVGRAKRGQQGGSFRIVSGNSLPPACYIDTNVQLLESADLLITVWNGESSDKGGGTSRVVAQAEALALPMIQFNPATGKRTDKRLENFADPDDPRNGLQVIRSLARHNGNDKPALESRSIEHSWKALDAVATRSSGLFRRAVTLSILLHGTAALVAAVAVSFADRIETNGGGSSLAALAAFEFILVAGALGFLLWHFRRGTQTVWLECRFGAEILRSVRFTRGLTDPLHFRIRRRMPEWYRLSLSAALATTREEGSNIPVEDLKRRYLRDRIDDQIGYFHKQLTKASLRERCLATVASGAGWAAVFVVLAAFLYKLLHSEPAAAGQHSTTPISIIFLIFFLPVALPLLAGIAGSLRSSLDIARRRNRYQGMIQSLEKSREWITQLETETQLRRAASHVEEMLLDEHVEWLAAAEAGRGH